MRKQYKNKKRSCKLCKPHKMGFENRWHISDQKRQASADNQLLDIIGEGIETICELVGDFFDNFDFDD